MIEINTSRHNAIIIFAQSINEGICNIRVIGKCPINDYEDRKDVLYEGALRMPERTKRMEMLLGTKIGYLYSTYFLMSPVVKLFVLNCPNELTEKELMAKLNGRYAVKNFSISSVGFGIRRSSSFVKRAWRSKRVETIDYCMLNDDDLPD
ncbi:MAG: hypothetical protein ACE5HR_00260 [bacterium]